MMVDTLELMVLELRILLMQVRKPQAPQVCCMHEAPTGVKGRLAGGRVSCFWDGFKYGIGSVDATNLPMLSSMYVWDGMCTQPSLVCLRVESCCWSVYVGLFRYVHHIYMCQPCTCIDLCITKVHKNYLISNYVKYCLTSRP